MSAVFKSTHPQIKKKRQLTVLVLSVFVVIFLIWSVWVGFGGLSKGSKYDKADIFSGIIEDSNKLDKEFADFKLQLNKSWQQVQNFNATENKKQQLIDDLKNKIQASAVEEKGNDVLEVKDKSYKNQNINETINK